MCSLAPLKSVLGLEPWGYVHMNSQGGGKKEKKSSALTLHSVSDGFNYQND